MSVSFDVQNASIFFDQFRDSNLLQHGSEIVLYFGDISGGLSTNPPVVPSLVAGEEGWIKKFTGFIVDPEIAGAVNSRSMSFVARDQMWSVMNARARISKGTPTQQVLGHLEPFDNTFLVYQIIDKTGEPVIDLDESTIPLITRFVKSQASTYDNPFPAGPYKVLSPNDYDVNYINGRIVFRESQEIIDPDDFGNTLLYGYTINCHRYSLTAEPYELEDCLRDFLEASNSIGGTELTYGTHFDFFDIDGDSMFNDTTYAITISTAPDEFTIAGDQTANPDFAANSNFRVKGSFNHYNDKIYEVNSAVLSGGDTVITVKGGEVKTTISGTIHTYAGTGIKVSKIDWNEDTGIGQDFIQMLRDSGVMPTNYFLRCDPDGKIRGEFKFQTTTVDRFVSRPVVFGLPNTLNDIFTRTIVISNGNTYPKPLITATNGTFTVIKKSVAQDTEIPIPIPNVDIDMNTWKSYIGASDRNVTNLDFDSYITAWQEFGEPELLLDQTVLTYYGFYTRGKFKYQVPENTTTDDEFFYPFPNVPLQPYSFPYAGGEDQGGQDDFAFVEYEFDDVQEDADKLILSMYIPKMSVPGSTDMTTVNLRTDGDSTGPYDASKALGGFDQGGFTVIRAVHMLPLISVTYGLVGDTGAFRGLGREATAFTMDPMKSDTKIIEIDKTKKIKFIRVTFHRPFVCQHVSDPIRRVALYFLNTFQVYDRGTIYLPGLDSDGRKVYPFARITGTDADSSLIGEDGNLSATPVVSNIFQMPNSTLDNLQGTFVCIPNPTGAAEPYIAQVDYIEKDYNQAGVSTPGTMAVHTLSIPGRDHTNLLTMGVANTDTAYFMHNRYWLDLLFRRIDLYRLELFTKLQGMNLEWKTSDIQNDELVDLGTCLRLAVSEVFESISNFSGVVLSLAYRPDYKAGETVTSALDQTRNYFLTALDYDGSNQGIVCGCKLINYAPRGAT